MEPPMTSVLLGQPSDPNIKALIPHFDLLIDQTDIVEWDVNDDILTVNGRDINMTSYFGRANVFEQNTEQKRDTFYLLKNYVEAHENVNRYNKGYNYETPMKAYNLFEAQRLGLRVPRTMIGYATNYAESIKKPLTGGKHVIIGNRSLSPAILQERQPGRNFRLFIVGGDVFTFEVQSKFLDYRDDPKVVVVPARMDAELISKAKQLTYVLGLDFCAMDFMEDVFLEVNTGPMFAAFDAQVAGSLSLAIAENIR
jgi:hypothetical protein